MKNMDGDSDIDVSGLRDGLHKVANEETDTAAANDDVPSGATCRICRGDATDDNPLFHPCKCKGSIKYMHESCLLGMGSFEKYRHFETWRGCEM